MKKRYVAILAFAVIIFLVLVSGCARTMETGSSPPSTAAPAAVSINATPVHYADVNGVRLGYREFGAGEPLLLIEGFGATIDTWNATFLGILASNYHVYTYDHRGMGYSSNNNATPTIPLYADDASGLIKTLGYESMNVYGVSMGSTISQQLVIDHPERVRKLVLSSATYDIRIAECTNLHELIESYASNSSQPDGIRREAEANLAWNGSYDRLPGIQKDVMLIVGTNDVLTPDPVSVKIAGQINGSWLMRFADVPHAGEHYAPVQYGNSVLYFLGTDESPMDP